MDWKDKICEECNGEGKHYYEKNKSEGAAEGVCYSSRDDFDVRAFKTCRHCNGKGILDWIDILTGNDFPYKEDDKIINMEIMIKPVKCVEYVETTFTIKGDPEEARKALEEITEELYGKD